MPDSEQNSLFSPQLLAYELAELIAVVSLRKQGGLQIKSDGYPEAPRHSRGLTLTQIADAINGVFNDANLDVQIALPNLYPILKRLGADPSCSWVVKGEGSKIYFFRLELVPEQRDAKIRQLRRDLESMRTALGCLQKFVEKQLKELETEEANE
jgi:hypothetical protein